jgi:uncharacterized protein (TIGR02594 family)
MKIIPILLIASAIASCSPASNWITPILETKDLRLKTDNPAFKAANYLGYTERTHRAELKELTGVDPVRTEWCAAFINAVLEESGITSNNNHKYPLTARAFLDWGMSVSKEDIKPGDIVVFPRGTQGWQGHVGFYLRSTDINGVEYYYILGGNQSNKVSIELYRASRALGIRSHSESNQTFLTQSKYN